MCSWETGTVTEFHCGNSSPSQDPPRWPGLTLLHGVSSHTRNEMYSSTMYQLCKTSKNFTPIHLLRLTQFSLAFEHLPFLFSLTLDNFTYLVVFDYYKWTEGEVVYNSVRACALLAGSMASLNLKVFISKKQIVVLEMRTVTIFSRCDLIVPSLQTRDPSSFTSRSPWAPKQKGRKDWRHISGMSLSSLGLREDQFLCKLQESHTF